MTLFKNLFRSAPVKTKTIFIIENNPAYAKSLELYLSTCIKDVEEIRIFPAAELCMLELDCNPGVVIVDCLADAGYDDSESGIELIKRLKARKPNTNVILLSPQDEISVAVELIKEYNCGYVKKDEHAFAKVEELIKEAW